MSARRRTHAPTAGPDTSLTVTPDALLAQVLQTMPAGLFTVDSAGHITTWNREMESITGYPAAEVLGQSCSVLQSERCFRGPCAVEQQQCPLQVEGEVFSRRCVLRRRDGARITVLKNARLLRAADGQVVGAIEAVVDISPMLQLEQEVATLREEAAGRSRFRRLVGRHSAMQRLYDAIELSADSTSSVLIEGETGTGKELVAHAIHHSSPRNAGPFIRVSCAALSESLLESELFGHVRGAFTGAVADRSGRFEKAHGGTIFLDEIGSISPAVQTKLLRVLQERELERVGDSRTIKVDIRIVAAANEDLRALAAKGRFRQDLYYRLAVIPVWVPPLRERRSDIPLLVEHFSAQLGRSLGRDVPQIHPDAMRILVEHDWPGNVRELEHAIEYAFVLCRDGMIRLENLPPGLLDKQRRLRRGRPEREQIAQALREAGGNKTRAAQQLGVSRVTFWKWLRALGPQHVED